MRSGLSALLRRGAGAGVPAGAAIGRLPLTPGLVSAVLSRGVATTARASSSAAASALPSPVAPPSPSSSAPAAAAAAAAAPTSRASPRGRRAAAPAPSPPSAYDYQPGVLGEPEPSNGRGMSADLYESGGGGGAGGGGGYSGGGGGGGAYGGGGGSGGGGASSFAAAAAPSAAYTSWDVYKSKAALSARVIRPRWRAVGPSASAVALDREGVFLFELAPAAPDGNGGGGGGGGGGASSSSSYSSQGPAAPGTRRYDWASKLNVALSVGELGAILADPDGPHEFFHDPQKGRDGEGATRKVVRWAASPDGRAYFFQLTVTGGGGGGGGGGAQGVRQSVSVPVSKGELYVLRRLVDFSIPYLLGFDAAFAEMVAGGGGGEGEA